MTKQIILLPFAIAWLATSGQKFAVSKIEESRSTEEGPFRNQCKVGLRLSGDEMRNYKYVSMSALKKAVDDQGFDLLHEEKSKADYENIRGNVAEVELAIKVASRKATVIKTLEGAVTLCNPSEANGGIRKISNFQDKTGINLLPADFPVQVQCHTMESLEKAKKTVNQKQEDAAKKSVSEAFAEGFSSMFRGFGANSNNPNRIMVYTSGDAAKLVDIKFEDGNGERIDHAGTFGSVTQKTYSFKKKPAHDWKMILFIATDASIKNISFSLADIDLP